jgi:hypothetical protein
VRKGQNIRARCMLLRLIHTEFLGKGGNRELIFTGGLCGTP